MHGCVIVLTSLLHGTTLSQDEAPRSRVLLKVEDISAMSEIPPLPHSGYGSKPTHRTHVQMLDGSRYLTSLTAEAVMTLPCMDKPERQGTGRP